MNKLACYDFDNTLFRTPRDTPENRQRYEYATGIPWLIDKEMSRTLTRKLGRPIHMRRGWYGRPETLEPPLVPKPAPATMFIAEACDALHQSKADANTITLLLTGRHAGLKDHVLRIIRDGNLLTVRERHTKDGNVKLENADSQATCFFLGDCGPRPKGTQPHETLAWKLWIIGQYLDLYDIEVVEFWEDREEHVAVFQEMKDKWCCEVIVHHIRG